VVKKPTVPWRIEFLGCYSKATLAVGESKSLVPEMWSPVPMAGGPKNVLWRRVGFDSTERVAYYESNGVDTDAAHEARRKNGHK